MTAKLQRYKVWDLGTRTFHWVNAITVLIMIFLGILILNTDAFGIEGQGKVLLKTVHAYVGYVFVLNLLWRFIWAFTGNHYARWRQLLAIGPGYLQSLKEYIHALRQGNARPWLGHNPLGRLAVTLFFIVLLAQAITGLVIAGTDLYLPPFGDYFANWVTGSDSARLAALVPGDKSMVIDSLYKEMRAFREPFVSLHEFGFFVICFLVVIHLVGVTFTEVKEKNSIVSAMITGEKVIEGTPEDVEQQNEVQETKSASFNDGC